MTTGSPARAALIALDWGTSSLRAYRLDAAGRTLDTRHLPWGIMRLPQPLQDGAATTALSGFELAFEQACGDWLRAEPALPVIACGMVGSAQGWKEAAYLDVPVDLQRIGTLLTKVEREDGPALHIVPGLIQRHGLPNVIRGEETQVVGVMADQATRSADSVLIGLPGTHSKWVSARRGRVTHFDTFMTGEVYAALRGHTILGRTMADAASADMAAFERGLKVAG
ncbi:2-dehydro-3-deoxygalactonokinase, partial [Achromobacter xylosoxidans]